MIYLGILLVTYLVGIYLTSLGYLQNVIEPMHVKNILGGESKQHWSSSKDEKWKKNELFPSKREIIIL